MAGFFDALQRNLNGGDYYDRKSKTLNKRFNDDLNKMADDENYVYADINIYTKTTYCHKDKIRRKGDVFRMKIQRAIGVYDDCNASIHNVKCGSCGASFNAVREKKCPYCGNPYNLKQYDWVVTEFSRKPSVS